MRASGLSASLMIMMMLVAACAEQRGARAECEVDEDCTAAGVSFCHANEGRCVGCLVEEHCSCHEMCVEFACTPIGAGRPADALNAHGDWVGTPGEENYIFIGYCETSVDCRVGDICNPFTRGCMQPPDPYSSCQEDVRACPPGLECDPTTALCLPAALCLTDVHCCGLTEFRCSSADPEVPGLCFIRECTPPETVTSECPFEPQLTEVCPVGTFCSLAGVCVECVCDDDCANPMLPKCDTTGGECVSTEFCRAPEDCGAEQSCDRVTNVCAPRCADDAGCTTGELCDALDHVCRCAADAFEPNESQSGARPLAVPVLGGEPEFIDATLCKDDTDWYTVALERADRLQILGTSESDLEASLIAFAPDGVSQLGSGVVLGGGYANELDFTADVAGIYFLQVNDVFSRGDYRLEIVRSLGLVCDEGGRNDTVASATALNEPAGPVAVGCTLLGGDLTGAHVVSCTDTMRTCDNEVDYYSIHVPQGSELEVVVDDFDENIDLNLYGPFDPGEPFNDTRFADSSTSYGSSETVTAATRAEVYFVLLVSERWGETTSYDLRVELAPPGGVVCVEDAYDDAVAAEPFDVDGFNDRAEDASGLALEAMVARDLTLSMCVGEEDWFVLGQAGAELTAFAPGQRVAVSVTSASTSVEDLLLFIGDDAVVLSETVEEGASGAQSVLLPTSGELIFVAVVPTVAVTAPVDYTLRFELESPPACELDTLGDLAADDRNDIPADAVPLLSPPWPASPADPAYTYPAEGGDKLSACVGDDDWYRLDTLDFTAVDVSVAFDVGGGELGLAVFDSTVLGATITPGVPPATGRLGISADHGEAVQAVRVEPDAGEIYVMVYNRAGWPVTTYDLTIQMTPVGCIDDGLEDNDSALSATPVELTLSATHVGREDAYLDDLLVCDTDQDWFAVHLQPLDRIEAIVEYDPAQGNTNLFLYRPGGTGTSLDLDFDNGNSGTMAVGYEVPVDAEPGDYLVKLDPGSAGGNHNDYDLRVFVYRSCLEDRFGPATFANPTAVTLPSETIEYGNMQLCDNEDWFAVTASAATEVSICTRFEHDVADLDVQVFDTHAEPDTVVAVGESLTKKDFEEVVFSTGAGATHWVRVFLDVRSSGDITYGLWIVPDGDGCRDTCVDNVINGDETDTDCGGSCAGCANGYACDAAGDCLNLFCDGGVCR